MKRVQIVAFTLIAVVILAACGVEATPTTAPPATSTPTQQSLQPTATTVPTATPTPAPTSSPYQPPSQPTATPVSPTPMATATPTLASAPTKPSHKPTATLAPTESQVPTILLSGKQRMTLPDISDADLTDLVSGNTGLAFDLYQALSEQDGNLFYSPYSISLALAMTYSGARAETERQMADTLYFVLPQDRLHPAFNGLDLELASRGEGAEGKDSKGFRLNIVNAIWGQEDFEFLDEFLDVLAENYGAGLRLLDFVRAPEESRITINDWVSEQTEARIEDLIPKGVIDEYTRLILTNAIYFNAAWQYPFSSVNDGTFHLLDGGEVTVPMMRETASFGYAAGEGYQALELLYDGRELSMVILLPETGEFHSFEASLDADRIDAITKELGVREVALTMPKFEFESDFSLSKALSTMGMPLAFGGRADFSGMTTVSQLYIAAVIHKAFVSVDEAGTEAAAATAVVVRTTSMKPPPLKVTVDRPFIFFIRDIETGTILFIGRVLDPSV